MRKMTMTDFFLKIRVRAREVKRSTSLSARIYSILNLSFPPHQHPTFRLRMPRALSLSATFIARPLLSGISTVIINSFLPHIQYKIHEFSSYTAQRKHLHWAV